VLRGQEKRHVRTVFGGARFDRNFQDWLASCLPADEEVKGDLRLLRIRSRQLSRDNSIAIAYENAHVNGVLGPDGITLQAEFRQGEVLDEALNDDIEADWRAFCENPLVDGSMAMEDLDELLLRTEDIDGEIFVRAYDGYPNAHGFALQLVDADQVDEQQTVYAGVGRSEIRMGIQVTPQGEREGYWIHEDPYRQNGFSMRPRFVPAADVYHLGRARRPNQTRYVTVFHGVMNDCHLLEGYLESEAVAARNHAAPCMVYEDIGENPVGSVEEKPEDGSGTEGPKTNLSPGVEVYAPTGKKLSSWAPTHPNEAAPAFVKMWERRICAGLGVSKISVTNDVEDGNFSSQRIAIIADRDVWRRDQKRRIRTWKRPIARRWFLNQLRLGKYPRELFLQDAFSWNTRAFEYVSPLEDLQADVLALQYRLTSHQILAREQGRDARDVLEQWASIQKEADRLGVDLEPADKAVAAPITGENKNGNGNGGDPATGKSKPARSPRSRLPVD